MRRWRLSYRFVFVPVTIGSISWLAINEAGLGRIRHGFVISCAGDAGASTYKQSRRGDAMTDTLAKCTAAVDVLEHNAKYLNLFPKGEPQLGRRGLYQALGSAPQPRQLQMAVLWVLNQSDGRYDLLEIAERAGMPFALIHQAASLLLDRQLLSVIRHL